jgi:type II secretory pathway pseudopilin PulG
MIELVVALTVFAILAGGLALTIDSGLGLARNNRSRSVAANLASQEMDSVRRANFASLPLGLVDRNQLVDGVQYTVRRESEWVDNNSTTGPCDSNNAEPQVLRVTSTVFWSDMRGVDPVKSSTILSPPVGSYDPNNGHIAVKVMGSTAEPLAGVPVGVTRTGFTRNLTTTSDGCAFFTFVPPNVTYTVTLGAAGYVDRQGRANPTQVTGVTSGATSSVAFDYDQAASLTLTLTSAGGGTIPNGVSTVVGNTALVPTGTKEFTGTGSIRTLPNLFPYAEGYSAWAGSCADADPEGKDGNGLAYWNGATRDTELQTQPGGTAAGTVNLPTVEVRYGDTAVSAGTVNVVAVHDADNGCPTGLQYTVGTFSAAGTALVALPYGVWTLTVPGHTPLSGSWPVVTLDPSITGGYVANVDTL